jgi:hypothetical protein
MYRRVLAAAFLAVPLLATGCVERRFLIQSDPPGAIAYVNGRPVGSTPVDVPFVYYGAYDITLVRDGFETLTVSQTIKAPFYEYFPLDFLSENVYPGHLQDNRVFSYKLLPLQIPRSDVLLERADQLRQRGRQLPEAPPPVDGTLPPPRPRTLIPSGG